MMGMLMDSRIRNGLVSSAALMVFYLVINYLTSGIQGMLWNFSSYWYYILAIDVGFGTQMALYTHIRAFHQSCRSVATGGVSAGSMVACCLHHVTDFVPIFGTGLSFALSAYTEILMLIGVLSSAVGIAWMLATIQNGELYRDGDFLSKMMVVDYNSLKQAVLVISVFIAVLKFVTFNPYSFEGVI